jgi:hypothetical protein
MASVGADFVVPLSERGTGACDSRQGVVASGGASRR